MLQHRPRNRKTSETPDEQEAAADGVSTQVVLELLGDEYTRAVLQSVADEPRSGSEVAECTSMSKPTAFRRLNRLAEEGLVHVHQRIDTEQGHHHKVYEAQLDTLEVDLDSLLESIDT
ncbi:helix-turn-helix domain-containing protein [Halovenus rubra]|uniref:Helix-turn-helix domain-containing protein n=2 Tax=Halovenus rubra TaxID=869890 RepID=A0ACC7E4F2_9EURY|nr:winged helix-turn-helix domain-containing protein [Halovenus rubra]